MSFGATAHAGGKTEAWLYVMWLPEEGEMPWQMCVCAFLSFSFFSLFCMVFSLPSMTVSFPLL